MSPPRLGCLRLTRLPRPAPTTRRRVPRRLAIGPLTSKPAASEARGRSCGALRQTFVSSRRGGTLPDYRTETEAALSEERRACFVGVCRAETHLTLTRIEQYRGFRKPPSIFLEEMRIDPYD